MDGSTEDKLISHYQQQRMQTAQSSANMAGFSCIISSLVMILPENYYHPR
jgi:VIT1/CCC1 family predicted Fe2+/Mn2+ transporter